MKTKVKIVNTSNVHIPVPIARYNSPPLQEGEQGYVDGYTTSPDYPNGIYASVVIGKNIHAVPIEALEVISDTE